jgi:hypothetical protein
MEAMAFAAVLLLPLAAMAFEQELHEGKFWRNCADDTMCIAIPGKCGLTAVNIASRAAAAAYYKQEAAQAQCVERFWKPKSVMARCRLGQCETIPMQARNKK